MHRVGGEYPTYPPKVEIPPWANSYRVLWTGKNANMVLVVAFWNANPKGSVQARLFAQE